MDLSEFEEFLRAVRNNDAQGVRLFVDHFRPVACDTVGRKLAGSDLQRDADASDIAQSVVFALFQRVQDDRYKIESLQQLQALIRTMALNRLRDLARRPRHRHRSTGASHTSRANDGWGLNSSLEGTGTSPSMQAANNELVELVKSRLTPELRRVYDYRALGWSWKDIGHKVGASDHALRVRFTRAIRRCLENDATGSS